MFVNNRLGLTESVESLLAQEQRMNQVSNNVANVDTAGFKRENVTFWEMLYTASDNRQRVGKGLRPITNFTSGPMEATGNPLDLAINGEGFFRVQTPAGVRYTRAGNFLLNNQGQVVTPGGDLVLGEGGSVVLNNERVDIGVDGRIFQDGEVVDRLAVVVFPDNSVLERDGASLFRVAAEAQGQEQIAEDSEVRQGYLEGSNVQAVVEMTEMIDLYRNYESQQRAVRALDEIDGQAVQKVGKLTA